MASTTNIDNSSVKLEELCTTPASLIFKGFLCAKTTCESGPAFPCQNRDVLWYKKAMSITLTPEQEAWIKAHIATGDFASIEEAARQLIDDRIAELAAEDDEDDMAWAKPLVDEARAAITRGEFVSLEEHKAHNAALLASLKD